MSVAPDTDRLEDPVTDRAILPIASSRETLRLVRRLLRPRRAALLLTVLTYAGAGLAGLVAPWQLGRIVDIVRDGDGTAAITRVAVTIAAAALVAAVLVVLSAGFLARATAPALAQLREDVLDRAVHLDTERLEAAGAGDVLSRVGDDVRTVTTSLNSVVPPVIGALVTTSFTAVGLLALDWRLGLAGLAAAPCYVLALRWYLGRSAPLYRRERIAQGERAEALVTGLQGAATLRAFGREDAHLATVRAHSRRAADIGVEVFGVLTRWGSRNNGSELVGLVLVLGAGFLLVRSGTGTVGEATAAALFFHRLFNPIGVLLFSVDEIQSSGASLARMAGVVSMPVAPTGRLEPAPGAALRLDAVGHEFVAGRPVLHPTSLTLAPGEHVAVVGATGAGKTTLGAIAAGRLRPSSGRVLVGDDDLATLAESAVRRHVGVVSQELHVFTGTVADNLTLARAGATPAQLWHALATVGARRWVEALPAGLDTVIGDRAVPLGPAQVQQLALARVVLADPAVVVLDEATAEAGSAGARSLETSALAAVAGRAAIVIAHRLTQAAACDRVVVLHEGRIVEQGPHEVLLAAGGRYAALWQAWAPVRVG